MKKSFFATMFLGLLVVAPVPTMARVDVNVNVTLPPPIVFGAPPEVIALPDTSDVYAVPGIDANLFFWNGWWWRLWDGRWYRSHYYDRGWRYYKSVPSFYFDVDPDWRTYYRDHDWGGHRWNYQRIPEQRLKQDWKTWQNGGHWKKETWGVQGYQARAQKERQELRHQRQQQYQQRPEVRQHQQPRQQERRQPQVQPQRQQPGGRVQQPQRKEERPQVQQPERSQRQERGEGGEGEHRK